VLEDAANGLQRLVAWIREDPINERLFWSSMYMKLLPVQVQGSGENGSLVVNIKKEDLAKRLEERGLPPLVVDVPVPDLNATARQRDWTTEDLDLVDQMARLEARDHDRLLIDAVPLLERRRTALG
jgi:hypothetical protein